MTPNQGKLCMAVCALGFIGCGLMNYSDPYNSFWVGMLLCLAGVGFGYGAATKTQYPDPAEAFPPLPMDQFQAAMTDQDHTVFACASCRVVVSEHFSTGACPVCELTMNYFEVATNDDIDMVLKAAQ